MNCPSCLKRFWIPLIQINIFSHLSHSTRDIVFRTFLVLSIFDIPVKCHCLYVHLWPRNKQIRISSDPCSAVVWRKFALTLWITHCWVILSWQVARTTRCFLHQLLVGGSSFVLYLKIWLFFFFNDTNTGPDYTNYPESYKPFSNYLEYFLILIMW